MAYSNTSMQVMDFRKRGKFYDVVAKMGKKVPHLDAAAIFREMVGGRLAMVKGTYRENLDTALEYVVRFVAKPTPIFRAYADVASMASLGNSQFCDTASGDIWTAFDEGGERFLVLNNEDDLSALLAEKRARTSAISPLYRANDIHAEIGDFAAVVVDDSIKEGFVGVVNNKRVLVAMPETAAEKPFMYDFKDADIVEAIQPDRRIDESALRKGDFKALFDVLAKVYTKDYIAVYKAKIGA